MLQVNFVCTICKDILYIGTDVLITTYCSVLLGDMWLNPNQLF